MEIQSKKENKLLQIFVNRLWLVTLVVTPFVLWLLPATFFDKTGIEVCPSKLFFNIECFGCGMTRAVMHLHHFDLNEAIYFNYAVVVVYPLLIIIWIIWVRSAWKKRNSSNA